MNKDIQVISTRTNPSILLDIWNNIPSCKSKETLKRQLMIEYNGLVKEDIICINSGDLYLANAVGERVLVSFLLCGTRNGQIIAFKKDGTIADRCQVSHQGT